MARAYARGRVRNEYLNDDFALVHSVAYIQRNSIFHFALHDLRAFQKGFRALRLPRHIPDAEPYRRRGMDSHYETSVKQFGRGGISYEKRGRVAIGRGRKRRTYVRRFYCVSHAVCNRVHLR